MKFIKIDNVYVNPERVCYVAIGGWAGATTWHKDPNSSFIGFGATDGDKITEIPVNLPPKKVVSLLEAAHD